MTFCYGLGHILSDGIRRLRELGSLLSLRRFKNVLGYSREHERVEGGMTRQSGRPISSFGKNTAC